MMYEHSPIAIIAPAPSRNPSTLAEANVMFALRKPNIEECIVICRLIRAEFEKIHAIMDGVLDRLEEKNTEG
jgi:hypothetical protein